MCNQVTNPQIEITSKNGTDVPTRNASSGKILSNRNLQEHHGYPRGEKT